MAGSLPFHPRRVASVVGLGELDPDRPATPERRLEDVAAGVGQVGKLTIRQAAEGPKGMSAEDLGHQRAVPADDEATGYTLRSLRG